MQSPARNPPRAHVEGTSILREYSRSSRMINEAHYCTYCSCEPPAHTQRWQEHRVDTGVFCVGVGVAGIGAAFM